MQSHEEQPPSAVIAWERSTTSCPVRAWIDTWLELLRAPSTTVAQLCTPGKRLRGASFLAINYLLSSLPIAAFGLSMSALSFALDLFNGSSDGAIASLHGIGSAAFFSALTFFGAPLSKGIYRAIWLGTAVHLGLVILRSACVGRRQTLRAAYYVEGFVAPLGAWIPVLPLALSIAGTTRVAAQLHGVSWRRSVLATVIGMPLFLLLLLLAGATVAALILVITSAPRLF